MNLPYLMHFIEPAAWLDSHLPARNNPSRKELSRWLATALIVTMLCACQKNAGKQVKDHEPVSEAEYQALLEMELPIDGPLKQRLIYRNEVNYYTLAAATGTDLHAEIVAKGPKQYCKGTCSWSYEWHFLWKWDTRESKGRCSAKWINTKVFFDYHLPLWVREQEAAPLFQRRYAIWMENIWTQINRRTLIVLQEAARLERNVMNLPMQDCEALDRRIKSEGVLAEGRMNSRLGALDPEASLTARDWLLEF